MNGGIFGTEGGRDPYFTGAVVVLRHEPTDLRVTAAPPDPHPTIGVIDTGIVLTDGKLPEWAGDRILFDPPDADEIGAADAADRYGLAGHGTFVCGLILREHPDAVIRMKGVIDDTGPGPEEDDRVAEAITALGREVDLINLSFGGSAGEQVPTGIINAINELPEHVVLVAAAGNAGTSQRVLPAGMTPKHALMVSVGAVDTTGAKILVADFSNVWLDLSVFASGVNVKGPHIGGGVAARSGTSFAAAQVTGRIARTARERGLDARKAVKALLTEPDGKIDVWTVNGQHVTPYLNTRSSVLDRAEQGW